MGYKRSTRIRCKDPSLNWDHKTHETLVGSWEMMVLNHHTWLFFNGGRGGHDIFFCYLWIFAQVWSIWWRSMPGLEIRCRICPANPARIDVAKCRQTYHYIAIRYVSASHWCRISFVSSGRATLPRCIVPPGRAQPLLHEPYQGSWPMERRRLNAPWHFWQSDEWINIFHKSSINNDCV